MKTSFDIIESTLSYFAKQIEKGTWKQCSICFGDKTDIFVVSKYNNNVIFEQLDDTALLTLIS